MYQNQGGYPQGGHPQGGYPQGGHPQGDYPQGGHPQGDYPQGGHPRGGYPQGGHPQGGYPQGGHPQGDYPLGGHPQGGYPQGGHPHGDYPQGGHPQGGYPQGGHPPPPGGYPPQPGFQPGFQPGYGEPAGYVTGPRSLGENVEVKGFDFTDQTIRRAFIRKVYSILMCQMLVTMSFIALFLFHRPTNMWVQINGLVLFYVALVVVSVCLIAMACFKTVRRKSPMNFIFLGIFTVAESFMLAVTSSVYSVLSVMMAVGITAGVCLALTLFAIQTKWDFTTMGGILVCCAVVLLLFGLIAIFLRNNIVGLVYGSLGALVFSFYLVYDTQRMMGGKHKYSISPEEYVFATLNLYTDIVNIFVYLFKIIKAFR